MNRRALLIVGGTALGVLLAIAALGETVLVRSFARIENDAIHRSIARVRKALEADLAQLAASNRDRAQRDDAYRFLESGDRGYLDAHYRKETLDGLRVDLVWIADGAGREVYSAERRDDADATVSPARPEILEILRRKIGPLARARLLPPTQRLVRLPDGLVAFSIEPVLRTDLTGPALGHVLWARYLRSDEIARLSDISQLPVSLVDVGPGANVSGLPAEVRAWLASPPRGSAAFALPRDPENMNGYALLREIDGEPAALLVTSVRRDVLLLGERTAQLLTAVVAALVLAFVAVVLFLFARLGRSLEAREASERRYRAVVSQIDEAIVLAEESSGRIVEVNAALLRRLGCDHASILGRRIQEVFVGGPAGECHVRARDGRMIDLEVSRSELVIDGRQLVCLVARDVSARKRAERQLLENQRKLVHLAHHDSLTTLPNRLYLQSVMPRMLERAARTGKLLALLYVDVDRFKDVNDLHGHGTGDELLRVIAQRLRNGVSMSDLVVRMGGDEFVVVAGDLDDRNAVEALAQRVRSTLAAPVEIGGVSLGVTVSMGISTHPTDGDSLELLLKHADIALYQAKDRGRNNHQHFAADMNARLMERIALEQALRHAIGDTDQLFVEYQPIVDLATGAPIALEALVRWKHPELGIVPPGRFVPIAESSGSIVELGERVLRDVCRQINAWALDGVPLVPVSINLSPRQLERCRIQDTVAAVTREYGIDPALLAFEITEGAVMRDIEQHLGTLHALRRMGSRIAVDDFGTGYSSLSYLKHLPIDALKIDRAFVRDMATSESDAAIVTAIVNMAGTLGLRTVAEGVETESQADRLRALGCDAAQGYHFSRPMSAEACRELLRTLPAAPRRADTMRVKALRLGGADGRRAKPAVLRRRAGRPR